MKIMNQEKVEKNNPREEKCQKANHNTLKSQEVKF